MLFWPVKRQRRALKCLSWNASHRERSVGNFLFTFRVCYANVLIHQKYYDCLKLFNFWPHFCCLYEQATLTWKLISYLHRLSFDFFLRKLNRCCLHNIARMAVQFYRNACIAIKNGCTKWPDAFNVTECMYNSTRFCSFWPEGLYSRPDAVYNYCKNQCTILQEYLYILLRNRCIILQDNMLNIVGIW